MKQLEDIPNSVEMAWINLSRTIGLFEIDIKLLEEKDELVSIPLPDKEGIKKWGRIMQNIGCNNEFQRIVKNGDLHDVFDFVEMKIPEIYNTNYLEEIFPEYLNDIIKIKEHNYNPSKEN